VVAYAVKVLEPGGPLCIFSRPNWEGKEKNKSIRRKGKGGSVDPGFARSASIMKRFGAYGS